MEVTEGRASSHLFLKPAEQPSAQPPVPAGSWVAGHSAQAAAEFMELHCTLPTPGAAGPLWPLSWAWLLSHLGWEVAVSS